MDNTGHDILTTHMSRRFKKGALLNATVGFVLMVLFLHNYTSNEDVSVMALIGAALSFIAFAAPLVVLLTVRYPLRITGHGVVAKYFATPEITVRWEDIAGLGIHPKRNTPCLFYRDRQSGETRPLAIAWSMIWEDQNYVMELLKEQLILRGHRFDDDGENAAMAEDGQVKLPSAMKDFWR
jgi:hypothetical protein